MADKKTIEGLIFEKKLTFIEVCNDLHVSKKFVIDLIEHGLLEQNVDDVEKLSFDEELIQKIMKAQKFHEQLNVNTPGVLVILDLLDELEEVRSELEILKRHLGWK